MDMGEILQNANNIVQLDMDVAQKSISHCNEPKEEGSLGEGGGRCSCSCRGEHFMGNMRD